MRRLRQLAELLADDRVVVGVPDLDDGQQQLGPLALPARDAAEDEPRIAPWSESAGSSMAGWSEAVAASVMRSMTASSRSAFEEK